MSKDEFNKIINDIKANATTENIYLTIDTAFGLLDIVNIRYINANDNLIIWSEANEAYITLPYRTIKSVKAF